MAIRDFPETASYLDTRAAARFVGLAPSTLTKLRISGRGPAYLRPTDLRRVLYSPLDLEAWLQSGRRQSTSPKRA